MSIIWKKVSEHPLPVGDGFTIYVVFCEVGGALCTRRPHSHAGVTHWSETNRPESEPDKEPEIELWSVVQTDSGEIGVVIGDVGKEAIKVWEIDNQKHGYWFHSYKPRPDLEVLAPVISKMAGLGTVEYVVSQDLISSKDSLERHYYHQWPSSLSQMIIVPKGGV